MNRRPRRAAIGAGVLALALSGCAGTATPAVTVTETVQSTVTVTPVPMPEPGSGATTEPPAAAEPDEAGFAAAIARGDPTWKWPSRQVLVDTGYNICSLLETSPDVVDNLFPNPKRQAVYVQAAKRYLCP